MPGLSQIPPWLEPPNFIGAMRSGAELGLAGRRQDVEESQTADRLKLAYEQLGAKERMAAKAMHAHQLQAQAALALRSNFLDLAMRNATERERHNRALEGHARTAVSELQKFDISDAKKRLGKLSQELRDDPAWTELNKSYPHSTKALQTGTADFSKSPQSYEDAVEAFNRKQSTVSLLRNKLSGMGKGAAPALTFDPNAQDFQNQEED